MNRNLPRISGAVAQLRLVEALDAAPFPEVQANFEEEREQRQRQTEAEDFWAGRGLAARNSTRQAA